MKKLVVVCEELVDTPVLRHSRLAVAALDQAIIFRVGPRLVVDKVIAKSAKKGRVVEIPFLLVPIAWDEVGCVDGVRARGKSVLAQNVTNI